MFKLFFFLVFFSVNKVRETDYSSYKKWWQDVIKMENYNKSKIREMMDKTFSSILVPGPFSLQLNPEQKAVLEELTYTLESMVYDKKPIPYGFNILGSAGSGKTFLQSAFLEQCAARKIGLISMVYTGMGSTLCFCLTPEGEIVRSDTYNKTMSVSYASILHNILDIKDLSQESIDQKLKGLWRDR